MTDYQRIEALPAWQDAIAPYGPAFQRGLLFVLAHEVEYHADGRVKTEHDPQDGGGTTRLGVDLASHPNFTEQDIENLTLEQAAQSYFSDEWFRAHGEQLPERLAIAHFDGTVNIGVRHSSEMLQQAVGATPDGSVGPLTIAKALAAPQSAVEAMLHQREEYYRHLRQFPRYGKGWIQRVKDLREFLAV